MKRTYWYKRAVLLVPVLVIAITLFALVPAKAAPNETFTVTEFPGSYELYPRNIANNQATVHMAGTVESASMDAIRVDVLRDGVAYDSQTVNLSAGVNNWTVDVTITAETANYTFELYSITGALVTLQESASHVVAGDIFVIQGQSNAVAHVWDGFANPTDQNDFVRSFGNASTAREFTVAGTDWHIADGDNANSFGTIGQWALRAGNVLVQDYGIPLAFINGAHGGQAIDHFQRDDADPDNLDTNYGRLLWRMQTAGIDDDVRGIFWYQGESDEGNIEDHMMGFEALYQDWKSDYPGVENFYTFQIADFCFNDNIALRDAQRQLPTTYSDITVFSTNAIFGHRSDCHYAFVDGYSKLGDDVARTMARDYYGGSNIAVDAPDIDRAFFSNAEKTEITLRLENVEDGLVYEQDAIHRFKFISDVENEFVFSTSQQVVGSDIVFQMNAAATGRLTIEYKGDDYLQFGNAQSDTDDVTNINGVGLYAFLTEVFESEGTPNAEFTLWHNGQTGVTTGVAPFQVTGQDLSTDPQGDYIWWVQWDWGDGSPYEYGNWKAHTYNIPGSYDLTLTVSDGDGGSGNANNHSKTQNILVFLDTTTACATHGLNYERYADIPGTTIADLTSNAAYPDSPTQHRLIQDFEIPEDIGDDYGGRVRGYIVAPISGEYRFWVASDDQSQVFLSTDENPANTSLLVEVPSYSPPRLWEQGGSPWYSEQWTETTVNLTVGEKYYVEALYKEGSAGDHLSLAWQLPGSANWSLIENDQLCVFTEDIPASPVPQLSINFQGGSSAAPVWIDFNGESSFDPDGTIAHWKWEFSDGDVISGTNPFDYNRVYKQFLSPGTVYVKLTVTDNEGFSDSINAQAEVTAPECGDNGIYMERWDNVPGLTVGQLLTSTAYAGDPDFKDVLDTVEFFGGQGDESGAHLRGYLIPNTTGLHTFRIASDDQSILYISSDDNPANVSEVAAVYGWTTFRQWEDEDPKYPEQESAEINLVAGERYYFEVLYKEWLWDDHLSVAWKQPGESNFGLLTCANIEPVAHTLLDLDMKVEASRATIPSSGALIEYTITLSNTSPLELLNNPIQVTSIVDSEYGDIAPNTTFWENSCWWWLPNMYVDQVWECQFVKYVENTSGVTNTITLNAVADDGTPVTTKATSIVTIDAGPGVISADGWETGGGAAIDAELQTIDFDGELDFDFNVETLDGDGILIGDYDFDGTCDLWQVWWLRDCIALSKSEALSILQADAATLNDMRYFLMRELLATWLNIHAGNEYICEDMGTVVNLSLVWLHANAPEGKPWLGGTAMIATDAQWVDFEWAYWWMEFYNNTGGTSCAIDGEVARSRSGAPAEYVNPRHAQFMALKTDATAWDGAMTAFLTETDSLDDPVDTTPGNEGDPGDFGGTQTGAEDAWVDASVTHFAPDVIPTAVGLGSAETATSPAALVTLTLALLTVMTGVIFRRRLME